MYIVYFFLPLVTWDKSRPMQCHRIRLYILICQEYVSKQAAAIPTYRDFSITLVAQEKFVAKVFLKKKPTQTDQPNTRLDAQIDK